MSEEGRASSLACGCEVTKSGNVKFCQTHRMAREFRDFCERNIRTFTPAVQAEASQLLNGGEPTLVTKTKREVVSRGCGCRTEWLNGTIVKAIPCAHHEALGA